MIDFLEIEKENFNTLMGFETINTHLKLWPVLRGWVISNTQIINKLSVTKSKKNYSMKFLFSLIKNYRKTVSVSPFKREKQTEMVVFTSMNQYTLIENQYENRIYAHLFDKLNNNVLSIEYGNLHELKTPRKHSNYKLYGSIQLYEEIYKRTIGNFNVFANLNVIKRFCETVGNIFELSKDNVNKLERKVKSIIGKEKYHRSLMKKLFIKLNPKIVAVHCGVYGDMDALTIYEAKKLGIKTIELQHGNINYSNYYYRSLVHSLEDSTYMDYIPHEIGLFGAYYKNMINLPMKKVILGYPHFTNQKKNYISQKITPKMRIIFLSQWTVTDKIMKYAINLKNHFKEKYEVSIRLHPREYLSTKQLATLLMSNINISHESDLYKDILNSKFIVSVHSFAIYEAIGMNLPVFILDDKLSRIEIPKGIGNWVSSVEEMINKIENNQFKIFNNNIFDDDYEILYDNYFQNIYTKIDKKGGNNIV